MSLLARIDNRLRLRTALEDHLLTRPSPFFRPAFSLDAAGEARAGKAVAQLGETGAHIAGVRTTEEDLKRIAAALEDAYAGRRPDLKVKVDPRTANARILNPLRVHPALLRLAADALLCGIVERYLRRRVVLADVDIRRVPPLDMAELDQRAGTKAVGYTSSHWHHDIRGRQAKVMFYLTDVGAGDSCFTYLPTTHHDRYRRPRHVKASRFSEAWVDGCGIAPVECHGAAGTAMVFDTNIIHRLRRRSTARVRDSVTFYYTPGQETRALDVDPHELAALSPAARALFSGKRPVQELDASV